MAPKNKWNDELNVKFVELYKVKECLWNQFDPLYKHKFAREIALHEIASEMNLEDFGVAEVKAKIKALRSTYHLEVEKQKKSEKSGSGMADIYVPRMKWFNIMKDVMAEGAMKIRTQSSMSPGIPGDFDDGEPTESPPEDARSPLPADDCSLQNSPSAYDDSHPPPTKKKSKPRPEIQQIGSTAQQLQQLRDSSNITPSGQNEFDIFGNLVAAHLKQMSTQQALAAELKILAVLNECRMKDLEAQTPAHSTTYK